MEIEDREDVIDECIERIRSLIVPECSDHTPHYGPCSTCGSMYNGNADIDPENVIEELEKLKEYD